MDSCGTTQVAGQGLDPAHDGMHVGIGEAGGQRAGAQVDVVVGVWQQCTNPCFGAHGDHAPVAHRNGAPRIHYCASIENRSGME